MNDLNDDGTPTISLGGLQLYTSIATSIATSLILQDETGQAWAIKVGSDGQLETARYPDGEPQFNPYPDSSLDWKSAS